MVLLCVFIGGPLFHLSLSGQETDSAIIQLRAEINAAKAKKDWQAYSLGYNRVTERLARDESRFWEAYQHGQKALDSIGYYLSDTAKNYSNALANQAYFCRRLGQLKEAKSIYQKSIELYQIDPNRNSEAICTAYYMLGTVYFMEGNWLEAKARFEKSIAVWVDAGMPPYSYTVSTYLHLGYVFRKLEDWASSRAYYGACLNFHYRPYRIEAGYGMAWAFLEENKSDTAQMYLDYAIRQQDSSDLYIPQKVAEIQAKIFALQGREKDALGSFREAQRMRVVDSPYRFEDLSIGEKELADHFLQMAMYDSAFQHVGQAFAYLELPNELPLASTSTDRFIFPQQALELYILKGNIYQAQYERDQHDSLSHAALACYEKGFELYRGLREDRVNEANKLLLSDLNCQLTEGALTSIYALLRAEGQAFADQALLWMERYHGGILYSEFQRSEAFLEEYLPDSIRVQEKNLLSRISYLRSEVQEARDDETRVQKQNELFERREAYGQFRTRTAMEWPQYGQQTKPISLPSLRQGLQDLEKGAKVLSFFWGKSHLFALTVSQNFSIKLEQISGQAALAEKVPQFHSILETPDYSPEGLDSFCHYATGLYAHLSTILSPLSTAEALFIQPDGALANLPFELLVAKRPEIEAMPSVSAAYRHLPYWGRELPIAYFHSLNLMLTSSASKPPKHASLAVFAPRYAGAYHLKQNESISSELSPYLSSTSFSFEKATKARLLNEMPRYAYSHVSVHGYPNEESPWDAYLQFAPHDSSLERLYVHEIYTLELPGSLVTLAACDVGKGRLEAGEGILSLARAFRYAGASTVIQSRWRADARVASMLFPSFYQELAAKESSLAAFSLARKEFLEEAPIGLTHPHFWANFAHWGVDKEAPASFWWGWIALILVLFMLAGIYFYKK